ncbi:MAG: hypothetical protein VCD00_10370, partial [Candidatus Hydrogenedentota bacterium]
LEVRVHWAPADDMAYHGIYIQYQDGVFYDSRRSTGRNDDVYHFPDLPAGSVKIRVKQEPNDKSMTVELLPNQTHHVDVLMYGAEIECFTHGDWQILNCFLLPTTAQIPDQITSREEFIALKDQALYSSDTRKGIATVSLVEPGQYIAVATSTLYDKRTDPFTSIKSGLAQVSVTVEDDTPLEIGFTFE